MQKVYQKYFRERARGLYESERIDGRTQERFRWDYNLKPMTNALRFVFLELGRINKQISELKSGYIC